MDPIMLIFLVLIFGMLILMMNRNRKQQREQTELRRSIAAGDEVMTSSGMYGTVTAVDGNVVTIESTPGNASRWFLPAIAKKVDPATEYASSTDAAVQTETTEPEEGTTGTSTPDGFLSDDQVRRPYRDENKD